MRVFLETSEVLRSVRIQPVLVYYSLYWGLLGPDLVSLSIASMQLWVAVPGWQGCKSWSVSKLLLFFLHCCSLKIGRFPNGGDFFFGKTFSSLLTMSINWPLGSYSLFSRGICGHGSGTGGENRENQNVWRTKNIFVCTSGLIFHKLSEITCYSLDFFTWISSQDPSLSALCCNV